MDGLLGAGTVEAMAAVLVQALCERAGAETVAELLDAIAREPG